MRTSITIQMLKLSWENLYRYFCFFASKNAIFTYRKVPRIHRGFEWGKATRFPPLRNGLVVRSLGTTSEDRACMSLRRLVPL